MINRKHFTETTKGPWETWNIERDIQIRIEKQDKKVFIYFQGSSTGIDWRVNFTFWIKPYKRMETTWYAHRGFVVSYKSIRDRILEEIEGAEEVHVSGFSQGAAYAIMTHEDLKFNNYNVKTVAYAPPRVFWFWNNKKIEERFEDLTLVINRGDIVTKVPFWIFGYRHNGKKLKIGKRFRIPHWKHHYPIEYEKNLYL